MTARFVPGTRVRLPGEVAWATVDGASQRPDGGWRLYLADDEGGLRRADLDADMAADVESLARDGLAAGPDLLAGLWALWMRAASDEAASTALATTPLRPYDHQISAVYGAMLPQPRLRFLLADEPGTGKTVMAGLWLREAQRLGLVRRALIVVPAHLVTKWQADFERFFGGGLRHVTAATVQEGALGGSHDLWVVSLDLAARNPGVQEALLPERAGWDAVVFDEAHRLTPTAETLWRVGRLLSARTPRALLMTATPHRGKERLFRGLMHLVDPELFSPPPDDDESSPTPRPPRTHYLRRMKEGLVDRDGETPLFRGRHASNLRVPLSPAEQAFYDDALALVDDYFTRGAAPLARMVYGKRAASSLYALRETLLRRRDRMGSELPVLAAAEADPDGDDPAAADEARVIAEASRDIVAERRDLDQIIGRLTPYADNPAAAASKWHPVLDDALDHNGIRPSGADQAVLFTEYADTADWLVRRFRAAGFTAERYSGRDAHSERDRIRGLFAERAFRDPVSRVRRTHQQQRQVRVVQQLQRESDAVLRAVHTAPCHHVSDQDGSLDPVRHRMNRHSGQPADSTRRQQQGPSWLHLEVLLAGRPPAGRPPPSCPSRRGDDSQVAASVARRA